MAEAIHFDMLRSHGGMPGVRDDDGLESALTRAQQRLAYEPDSDLARLAAAYGFAAGTLTEAELAAWLRVRTVPRTRQ